jgi:hypothetical protein
MKRARWSSAFAELILFLHVCEELTRLNYPRIHILLTKVSALERKILALVITAVIVLPRDWITDCHKQGKTRSLSLFSRPRALSTAKNAGDGSRDQRDDEEQRVKA